MCLLYPQGVYANLTIQLYREFDINSLRIWGAIYAVVVLVLWAIVFLRTLMMLRNGAIFESPCIEEVDLAHGNSKDSDDLEKGEQMGTEADKESANVSIYTKRLSNGIASRAPVTPQSL